MSEQDSIEMIHKSCQSKMFSFFQFIVSNTFSKLQKGFGNDFVKDLSQQVFPVIGGGFAYMKHTETFWRINQADTPYNGMRVEPIFLDDFDVRFVILPDVNDVNRNKQLLYSLQLFRVFFLHEIILAAQTHFQHMYPSLKFELKMQGKHGNDVNMFIADLANEINIVDVIAINITYNGMISDYNMNLVTTSYFVRDATTCDANALTIPYFCAYKAFKEHASIHPPEEDLQRYLSLVMEILEKLKRHTLIHKSKGNNEVKVQEQLTQINSIVTQLSSTTNDNLKVLHTMLSGLQDFFNNNTVEDCYEEVSKMSKHMVQYKMMESSMGKFTHPLNVIGTISNIDDTDAYKHGDVLDTDRDNFKYMIAYEELIMDTVRLLLQINDIKQSEAPALSAVYNFHVHAIKLVHLCIVYLRMYVSEVDATTYTDVSKRVQEFITSVMDRRRQINDTKEFYQFWIIVAKYVWTFLEGFTIPDVIKDRIEVNNIYLPGDMMKHSVFYGGAAAQSNDIQRPNVLYTRFNNVVILDRYDTFNKYP